MLILGGNMYSLKLCYTISKKLKANWKHIRRNALRFLV